MVNVLVWTSRGQGLAGFFSKILVGKLLGGLVRNANFAEQKPTVAALLGGVI